MKNKNRYRKARRFKFVKLSSIDYDGRYSEFEVDDAFATVSKNIIKRDWDFYDYKRHGSFYELNLRPYRRLIKSSVGKNWDNVLNYIKRKAGNKGSRCYKILRICEYNFPKRTFVEDGIVYEVESRWGGYNKVSPGDIYIGKGNVVQLLPSDGRRRRYGWYRKTGMEKFQSKYAEETCKRRKLLVNKDLLYREEKHSWNQRLGGGKVNVIDEYNWFRLAYREYMENEHRWLKNPTTGVYETVIKPVLRTQINRFSANKKEILKYKLRELPNGN